MLTFRLGRVEPGAVLRYFGNYLSDFVLSSAQQWLAERSTEPTGPVDLSAPAASRSYDDRFRHVRSEADPKQRWVDGTPEYSHYVAVLLRLFPAAKFLHIVRDPNDVALSLMRFSRVDPQQADYELDRAYKTWHRSGVGGLGGGAGLGAVTWCSGSG